MIPMLGVTTATIHTATKPNDWLAGLFGFALMVAYWPGISGVATTARWDVAATLVIALFFAPRVRMTASHLIGLLLIGWLFLTMLWNGGGSDGRLDGVEAGFEIVIAAIAFAVGSTMPDIRGLLIGAAIGLGVNSAFAVAQWYGFSGWDGIVQVGNQNFSGLFYERGRLGGVAAVVAVGLIAVPRLWCLLPLVLPALFLSGSRGGVLALAVGALATTRHAKAAMIVGVGALVAVWALLTAWHVNLDSSSMERLSIWRDTIANLTFFGHGLGSFREVFLQTAQSYDFNHWTERPEHPHNEALWLAFEGGVPGAFLGLCLGLALWRAACDRRERGILVAFAALCCFAMPLHDPATVVVVAIVAGHLAGRHALAGIVPLDCRGEVCPWVAAVERGNWA